MIAEMDEVAAICDFIHVIQRLIDQVEDRHLFVLTRKGARRFHANG